MVVAVAVTHQIIPLCTLFFIVHDIMRLDQPPFFCRDIGQALNKRSWLHALYTTLFAMNSFALSASVSK